MGILPEPLGALQIRLHAQEVAAAALRDLAWENPSNMSKIAAADAIEPLVDMLLVGSEEGKEISATALKILAGRGRGGDRAWGAVWWGFGDVVCSA